jgi:hypothetical protein
MSNKTISINPSLFNIGSSKTKKNKEKKKQVSVKPLINPNILKNKLLKRIKEHKQRETQGLDKKNNTQEQKIPENPEIFTDEFNESINYLQTLSKQKKVNDEKTNYEKQKQRKREELEKRTLKNYQALNHQPLNNNILTSQNVNIDLPEELQLQTVTTNIIPTPPITLNKYNIDTVPYGVLKGGIKPTYRNWTISQRNATVTNPSSALTIQGGGLNKDKVDREMRLQVLREKLKNKQAEKVQQIEPEKAAKVEQIELKQTNQTEQLKPDQVNKNVTIIEEPKIHNTDTNTNTNSVLNEQIIATKKITKRTIKRKYTLGKSKIKKAVGVLIKDRGTRKQIITAQKDLKKKPINDIKAYLRDHNLIKVGSNAPNDVIRKLYESAMLSGEITNSNSEILLHNFSKEDKQL